MAPLSAKNAPSKKFEIGHEDQTQKKQRHQAGCWMLANSLPFPDFTNIFKLSAVSGQRSVRAGFAES